MLAARSVGFAAAARASPCASTTARTPWSCGRDPGDHTSTTKFYCARRDGGFDSSPIRCRARLRLTDTPPPLNGRRDKPRRIRRALVSIWRTTLGYSPAGSASEEFSDRGRYNACGGIKLQFRDLDSFVHRDFSTGPHCYVKKTPTNGSRRQLAPLEAVPGTTHPDCDPFDDGRWTLRELHRIIRIASPHHDWPLLDALRRRASRSSCRLAGVDPQNGRAVTFSITATSARDNTALALLRGADLKLNQRLPRHRYPG